MRSLRIFAWAVVGATHIGCSYEALSTAETDVVFTDYDPNRNYRSYKTYALSGQVIDLCARKEELPTGLGGAGGEGGLPFTIPEGTNCREFNHDLDDEILEAVRRNFDAYGYERVASTEDDPDVVVLVGTVVRDNWFYAPGYAWCDPYYAGWCWYPTRPYIYNLPTGTVVITMADASESEDGDLSTAWLAVLSGLYTTSSVLSDEARVNRAVDQAFAQSLYLERE